jgi:NADP-dependent 3-hydroxy acid dehydrogenase YdfG
MRVAITGHTRGIGHAIAEDLQKHGHDVVGFSSSTGHDLRDRSQRDHALEQIYECDVFIDNAFLDPKQAHRPVNWVPIEMLYEVHRAWRGQENKTIVVIGSETQNQPMTQDHPYQIHKKALAEACRQLRGVARWPRVIQVNPGATDTDQIRHKNWIKMDAAEVAQVVRYCLDNLDRIYVNEITFTPGRKYLEDQSTNLSGN